MQLRDYQREAVDWLVRRAADGLRTGFIKAPAGSGKTLIAAHAVARVAWRGAKVGWLCNTIEQCQQAVAAIQVTQGAECIDFRICCAAALPDFSDRDIIVVDEAHHTPAATWFAPLAGSAAILWGFSATPFSGDEVRDALVEKTFGAVFEIDRKRLELAGSLEVGKVWMHDVDVKDEFNLAIEKEVTQEVRRRCAVFPRVAAHEHHRRVLWQVTQEYIQKNEKRNQKIISLCGTAAEAGQSVLLLVGSIEHGTSLVAGLPGAALVHSKVGKKVRRQLIHEARSGVLHTLVATSLADEGLDLPRASVLVLAAGGRSAGKLEQRAGRVLRPFEGKSGGVIHDFLDQGATMAYIQALARRRTYEKLGYEPEIVRLSA